ncbi:MAG: aspartyl protease family protein [Candidatus Obscuribacterales bacterium]|nr:aspartyl protease family protein [Candidatus Obscuribacterales bacterium]
MKSANRFYWNIGFAFFAAFCLANSSTCHADDTAYLRGVSFYNEKNYPQALKHFVAAVKTNPNNATALYYAGLCYSRSNAHDQASQIFRLIVQRFPKSQEAKLASTYLSAAPASPVQTTTTAASAARSESLPDQVIIPFSKGLGGHLMVDGELNGRPLRMIFDTGANSCCFGQNSLDQAGVSEQASRNAGYASGVGGNIPVKTMTASIKAGNLCRRLPILVQKNLFAPLLGQPFYEGYDYYIDNNAGIIRFTKQGSNSKSQSFDSVEIPYVEMGSSHIFVEADIDGCKLPVCFDTGAGGGISMSLTQLAAAGMSIPQDAVPTRVRGVAGESLAWTFKARVVRVGAIQKAGLPVTVLQGSLPCALIGEDFFGQRTYTIDKVKKVIRFSR